MKILTFHDTDTRHLYDDHCISLLIHLNQSSEVWLFNCNESTQHNLLRYQIKLSLISKIFITRFALRNICGLPGLLATLNLDDRNKTLEIYGPKKLHIYLKLNNKYSQTNYSYPVRIYQLNFHNIFFNTLYTIRIIRLEKNSFGYIITFRQGLGKFYLLQATTFNIAKGALYGKLKQHKSFITPDGNEIQGRHFSSSLQKGQKVFITPSLKLNKILKETYWKTDHVIYSK